MSSQIAAAVKRLLPSTIPPSLTSRPASLPEVVSRARKDGVGMLVHQTRWNKKGLEDCYWQVTRTKLKLEGKHGKVWGKLVWRGMCASLFLAAAMGGSWLGHVLTALSLGKLVSENDELIRGGLKYTWAPGKSRAERARSSPPQTSS